MQYIHDNKRFFFHILSVPFIYAIFIPAVFLDAVVELYHRVCFPLYGIPYVQRSSYIRIDRHRLRYLSLLQKFNCLYCGYMNGLFHYVSTVAGETEKYWCGIKHKNDPGSLFFPAAHQKNFMEYGDEQSFKDFAKK